MTSNVVPDGSARSDAEAARLRSTPNEVGTLLDVAGNGRYARKVIIACKRERARRLHPDFSSEAPESATEQIVDLLDGYTLAVEQAAVCLGVSGVRGKRLRSFAAGISRRNSLQDRQNQISLVHV